MNVLLEREQEQIWAQIFQGLDDSLRELEPMVPLFQLDRISLFRIYDRVRRTKEEWIEKRVCRFHDPRFEPDGLDDKTRDMLSKEEEQFSRLVDQMKRLIVASP